MRAQLLVFAVLSAAFSFAVVVACWLVVQSTSSVLHLPLESARAESRERLSLASDVDRLRAQLPSAADLAALHAAATECDRLLLEIAARQNRPAPAPFALGEPMPWRSWENRGQTTPRATLETALWAAAGGDARAFESLLELDPATRHQVAALLARLPASARQTYATPEALIAGVAIKNIPLGAAQLAWLHEADADHATLGLLLADPDRTTTPPSLGPAEIPPPMLPETGTQKLTFLSLHRTDGVWHLVVPAAALSRLTRELSPPSG